MAKTKKRPPVDDITLYDIDPAFQDKLIAWLSKKPHGVIVDIGATDDAFKLTFDPGGETISASFEDALNEAMGSRSRTKRIDPQLEERVHKFLLSLGAHLTFGASKDGVFNMTVSNHQARGVASDEDFEIALVLAEEQFWVNMPAHPLPAAKHAALAQALVPAAQREAEREAQVEEMLPPGMRKWALGQPTMSRSPEVKTAEEEQRDAALEMLPAGMHGLVKNGLRYGDWVGQVNDTLERRGYSFYDAQVAYWRQLYQAGFGPQQAAEEFETTWLAERGYAGNTRRPSYGEWDYIAEGVFGEMVGDSEKGSRLFSEMGDEYWRRAYDLGMSPGEAVERAHYGVSLDAPYEYNNNARRPPPAPSSRPFDPSVPPVRYAKPHHFAVNYDLQENARPKSPRGMYRREVVESLHMAGVPEYVASSMVYGDHAEFVLAAFKNKDNPEVVAHHIVEQERAASRERGYGWGSYDKNAHPMAAGGGFHGVPRDRRAQHAASGAWRIHVAGGDIDPQRFGDYDDAAQHARSKYGPGGWQVEWASV
jgi:hypothetical protein